MNASTEFHFDGWTLDPASGELTRGDQRIRLQSQPHIILAELLARPGEVVTREHLIARLWPGGVVDFDTALNSAVRRLRSALGDHAEAPRYIETIPKRGYRFIGRIDPVAPVPSPAVAPAGLAATRNPWHAGRRLVAAVVLLAIGAVVAVASTRLDVLRLGEEAATTSQVQELYQRAEHFFKRRTADDLELARRYYSDALALDPRFAPAWAGLAGVYWIQMKHGHLPHDEALPLVRDAAERALSIDPDLVEAHLRLGNYRHQTGDLRGAEVQLNKAMRLSPENPLVLSFSASMLGARGRFDEAIDLQRRSIEADPLSLVNRANLVSWLMMAQRFAEARAELLRVRELNPDFVPGTLQLAELNLLEGRYQAALELTDQMPAGSNRLFLQALARHGLGDEAGSDEALRALIPSARDDEPFRIVEALAFRGQLDEAFERLHASTALFPNDPLIQYSPFLQPLRQDPRWNSWIRSAERVERSRQATRASG